MTTRLAQDIVDRLGLSQALRNGYVRNGCGILHATEEGVRWITGEKSKEAMAEIDASVGYQYEWY